MVPYLQQSLGAGLTGGLDFVDVLQQLLALVDDIEGEVVHGQGLVGVVLQPLLGQRQVLRTHINGVPLKDSQLQEELQFDLPLLEELLHLSLCLVQLLQDTLDVVDGAVVGRLVAGDGRVPATGVTASLAGPRMRIVVAFSFTAGIPVDLLDEILSLLDDVDGDLQRGLLLLAKAFDQILDGLHRLSVNIVQQLLLELLQPRPQLQEDIHEHGVDVLQQCSYTIL
ncbi:hypothetical protein FQN60_007730 [Etheostoma spectabile]|uniref:Uncharacterized protein n=1 Tax=Etheostoma spectabile TaxID=54343 RepID=A0A5J5D3Q1_9PERO|nr:hypothetical protein FQN60_007730 [Etheostoma spectabile]